MSGGAIIDGIGEGGGSETENTERDGIAVNNSEKRRGVFEIQYQ